MITERAMLAADPHQHLDRRQTRSRSAATWPKARGTVSAGRYNKQLLRGADKLDELRTLAGRFVSTSTRSPCPGRTKGYRLLPAKLYFDLSARMREFEASFAQGVESFLDFYPSYIEHVRPELNGLFREEDYPNCGDAAQEVRREARSPAHSHRQRLPRARCQPRNRRASPARSTRTFGSRSRGTEDLWSRLQTVVSHMADRLKEPESRFHALAGDQHLRPGGPAAAAQRRPGSRVEPLRAEIRNRLCIYPAHELKKSDILRVATASDAAALLDEMDTVMRQREQTTVEETSRLRLVRARTTSSRTCRPIWRWQPYEQPCDFTLKVAVFEGYDGSAYRLNLSNRYSMKWQ